MKKCETCGSMTFDDMEMCFDCMSLFVQPVDEPNHEQAVARLHVALADYFSYELLLTKLEGRSLSVGSDKENAIVVPREDVAARQLEVFYAHEHIWVESVDSSFGTIVGELPLCGTVCVEPGTEITLGDTIITVLED